ncbi:phage tail tube protein [Salibacterium aidingense]|uniref:phage tail tube protein n=1 Tax=Salibacterium aidingense TaxID=384933 RepID=UPI003BBE7DFE
MTKRKFLLTLNLQHFSDGEGLLVQSQHRFEINTTPDATDGEETFERMAKGFNNFDPSNNEETDQTQYLDGEGFASTTVMGGQLTLSFSGHRYYGDPAQDWIFSKQHEIGTERETTFRWTMPTGEVFEGPCTLAEISGPSGDANAKGEITVAVHFNGKPVYSENGEDGTATTSGNDGEGI